MRTNSGCTNASTRYCVGMDVGSTTVKTVVVDSETSEIRWKDYRRHETRQPEVALDFLRRMEVSEPYRLDPSGDHALRLAKRVRRTVLRASGEQRLLEEADRYFGMPNSMLTYSSMVDWPLYFPMRSASI